MAEREGTVVRGQDGQNGARSIPVILTWAIPEGGLPIVEENFGERQFARRGLPGRMVTRSSEIGGNGTNRPISGRGKGV